MHRLTPNELVRASREELLRYIAELEEKLEKVGKQHRVDRHDMVLWPTCSWDLETTNLSADFAVLLCSTVKGLGRPPVTFRIDASPRYEKDRADDSYVVRKTVEELSKYVIDIGYNTQRFDLPFLYSRMLAHGMDTRVLRHLRHVDLIWAVRYRMRLRSARLEVAIEHLQAKEHKTPLVGRVWAKAAAGDRKAISEIVRHNVQDVKALEEIALKLAPLMDFKFFLVR